jgi:hypothetical protein
MKMEAIYSPKCLLFSELYDLSSRKTVLFSICELSVLLYTRKIQETVFEQPDFLFESEAEEAVFI